MSLPSKILSGLYSSYSVLNCRRFFFAKIDIVINSEIDSWGVNAPCALSTRHADHEFTKEYKSF